MGKTRFVAMIAQDRRHDLEKIAEDLGRAGLEIDQTLKKVGVVSGSADPEAVQRIKQVDGVAHVREEGGFTLPPFDEDTPQ